MTAAPPRAAGTGRRSARRTRRRAAPRARRSPRPEPPPPRATAARSPPSARSRAHPAPASASASSGQSIVQATATSRRSQRGTVARNRGAGATLALQSTPPLGKPFAASTRSVNFSLTERGSSPCRSSAPVPGSYRRRRSRADRSRLAPRRPAPPARPARWRSGREVRGHGRQRLRRPARRRSVR